MPTPESLLADFNNLDARSRAEFREAIGGPNPPTANRLWLLVVGTISLVIIGAAGGLIVSLFKPLPTGTIGPEIVLSLFTGSMGFLAGIFVPSPANS
jgi:hypothetical protein